jgi:predicted ribosome-associated RNA-binding protein Tma20
MAGKHLSFKQKFTISEYIRTQLDRIMGERPSFRELAEEIKKKLGGEYEILTSDVARDICNDIGVRWESRHPQPANKLGSTSKERVETLEAETTSIKEVNKNLLDRIVEQEQYIISLRAKHDEEMRKLQTQVDVLRGAISRLASDLNVTLPGIVPYNGRTAATIAPTIPTK